ncbi:MAG: penicillin-binding transpeptidase domain-containing protein [Oscillospiraceae bacterium]|nr:penicillin-binding transpeptidase domain-containing protein [Oscillospiraceae bacterium]
MEYKTTIRITALLVVLLAIIGIFIARLYRVQVAQSEALVSDTDNYTFLSTVSAARGNILDRNGKVLVTNRASYNLTVNDYIIYSTENTNENILTLVNQCDQLGLSYVDHLPISTEAPFTMTLDDLNSNWQGYFKTYMSERDWDVDMTATNLMKLMRETYNIPETWSDADARKVVGIRFELELRHYVYALSTYVLTYDVSSDALAAIIELCIPGVNVDTTSVREYNTTYAAHILGSVGKMTAEEYETYQELGYSMDASVGKEGFEKAFEEYLHGSDGQKCTVLSSDGTVEEEYYTEEPVAGNNVELSIDIDIQKVAEDALASRIEYIRENGVSKEGDGNGKDAEGGAVVVMDCKTGEVLACASYPTYNLATYSEDFNSLLTEEYAPLYNRALQAIYNPGSTFKMVTAIAAVDILGFDPLQSIEDKGIFTAYEEEGFTPRCMLYKNYGQTHGLIDMRQALSVSCNYYFYELGYEIYNQFNNTIDPIDEVSKAMGLGESTGIELSEEVGYRANADTKAKLYTDDESGFYGADALMAAIGQSENKFTVMQLATYASTLANEGTRYRATFLQRVVSADYSTLIKQNEPEIASQFSISDEAMSTVLDGMKMCATEGTAKSTFGDYSVSVCAKTGTAEHDYSGSSNASFICFAPADDPQIAIAIYLEKGAAGGALGPIAKAILDAYFAEDSSQEINYAEGVPG